MTTTDNKTKKISDKSIKSKVIKSKDNKVNNIRADSDRADRPNRQEEVDRTKGRRPKHVPLHKQSPLAAFYREGYKRRWVNEKPGEVEKLIKAGWAPVQDASQNLSDDKVQKPGQLGSVVREVVNQDPNAPCRTAILMEIPEEWFKEDNALEQKEITDLESSYDPKKHQQHGFNGQSYGHMEIVKK